MLPTDEELAKILSVYDESQRNYSGRFGIGRVWPDASSSQTRLRYGTLERLSQSVDDICALLA